MTDSRYPLESSSRVPSRGGESRAHTFDAFWEEGDAPLVGHVRTVLRNWRSVASVCAGFVALALVYLLLSTPKYTAEAKILIEHRAPQLLAVRELTADNVGGDDYYRTQEKILESRGLMIDTIRELALDRDPRFAPKPEPKGLLAGWAAALRRALGGEAAAERKPADAGSVQPRLLGRYREGLSVRAIWGTRLLSVGFTALDPELSAAIVNAHIAAYVRQDLRLQNEASRSARSFLETKRAELESRLQASEAALNAYRKDKGILSVDEHDNIVVERLSQLNDLLSQAEAERIRRESEAKLIQSRDYDALPQVASNTLIQALKRRAGELEADYRAVASEFKPGYPAVQRARARFEEMQERLAREVSKIVGSLESAYLAAVENEEELRRRLEKQKAEVLDLKDAAVRYAILEREVESTRVLYQSVLDRIKEVGITGASRASNVSVIESAVPPLQPSSPTVSLTLILALLGGLGSGVAFVVARELLDSSFGSPEEVERYLRLASLGSVPDLAALARGVDAKRIDLTVSRALEVGRDGRSESDSLPREGRSKAAASEVACAALAESYRNVRTGILFSRPEKPPQTLLFTSALPFEGKTTSVLNMGAAFQQLGGRVLVIDADLRLPRCHTMLRAHNRAGLSEVLTGQRSLEDVVQDTALEGLQLVSAGKQAPNPAELLGSRAMEELLERVAKTYDYVVVDAPPILAVSDAVVLAPLVEGVVLVVKAHATPRQIARRAETRLRQTQPNVLGFLLNQHDVRRDGYSAHYYSRYYTAQDAGGVPSQ